MSARKTVKFAKVVEGGQIFEILRDTFMLIGGVASEILKGFRDLQAEEEKQTALLERMAEVIAPTDEQRRHARMSLLEEAQRFEPEMDEETERSLNKARA